MTSNTQRIATDEETMRPRHTWLDPLACGAIYAIGVALIAGWPSSFSGADDRVALAGPVAAIVAALCGVVRSRGAVPLAIAAVAALVATVPTLWPMLGRWSTPTFALVCVGVAIVAAVDVAALGIVRRRGAGGGASLVLLGVAAASAGLIAMTGSIRIAEKTVPLAIALLLTAIVGAFLPARRTLAGVAAFGVAVTIAQLASAHLWSELALWQAACVLAAPILAAIAASVPFVHRRRPWLRALLIVLIAAIPAIVACGVAGAAFARASQSDGAGEYDNYY